MDVMEAIAKAKGYVSQVFADEGVAELELEETARNAGEWQITVSFSRPKSIGQPSNEALEVLSRVQGWNRKRLHKVVIIDADGEVVAMKDRAWMEATG